MILGILGTQYTPFDPPRLFVVGAEKCLHFPCNYCPRRQCNFPSYQMPKRKEQAWEFRVFARKQICSDLCTTYYNPSRLFIKYTSVPKKSSDPNKCAGINKRVQDRPSRAHKVDLHENRVKKGNACGHFFPKLINVLAKLLFCALK